MPLKFRCFRHRESDKVCYVPAGRYGNFLNSVKKLISYVRYNIPKYYVLHLGLTLKEASPEIDFKHLHRVLQFIAARLKRSGSDFKYIAVKEIQKERLEQYGEDAVHYHILCVYSKPYVFPHAEEIAKSWNLGNVKITAPKIRIKFKGIVGYIGKYIGKGYEYETLNFKKSFTASQIKQIYKLSRERLESVMSDYGKEKAETFKCTYRKVYEVFDNGFRLVRRLVKEFSSEWLFEGVCDEPF